VKIAAAVLERTGGPHRLPLEQVEHAFELLRSGSALRSVLDLGSAA
jgi:hypothetical protein